MHSIRLLSIRPCELQEVTEVDWPYAPGRESMVAGASEPDDPRGHPRTGKYDDSGPHSVLGAVGMGRPFYDSWYDLQSAVLTAMKDHAECHCIESKMSPEHGSDTCGRLLRSFRQLFTSLEQKLEMYWLLRSSRAALVSDGCGADLGEVDWDRPLRVILGAMCAIAVERQVVVAFSDGFCKNWNDEAWDIDPTPEEHLKLRGHMKDFGYGWHAGDGAWLDDHTIEDFHTELLSEWLESRRISMSGFGVQDPGEVVIRVPFHEGTSEAKEHGFAERTSVLDWSAAGCPDACSGAVDMSSSRCPSRAVMYILLGEAGLELFQNAGPFPDLEAPLHARDDDGECLTAQRWAKLAPFLFHDGVKQKWLEADPGDTHFCAQHWDPDAEDPAWKRQRRDSDLPGNTPREKAERTKKTRVERRGKSEY